MRVCYLLYTVYLIITKPEFYCCFINFFTLQRGTFYYMADPSCGIYLASQFLVLQYFGKSFISHILFSQKLDSQVLAGRSGPTTGPHVFVPVGAVVQWLDHQKIW